MAENEERKRFWHIFYSPLVFIVLLIGFLVMSRAMWRVYGHEVASSHDRERAEKELAAANERSSTLKDRVDRLQTSQGIEDEIRAKFNVTKPGEGVAIVVNNSASTTSAVVQDENKSWWQKFVGFFR